MIKELKKYSKLMTDEILGAETYVSMAEKYKDEHPAWSKKFANMAEQELEHKENLKTVLKDMIMECKDESGNISVEIMAIYDFIVDTGKDMESPIVSRIRSLK